MATFIVVACLLAVLAMVIFLVKETFLTPRCPRCAARGILVGGRDDVEILLYRCPRCGCRYPERPVREGR